MEPDTLPTYEWLIVGAGITGIYALGNFARAERADVLLVEQQDRIGGLWAWIPRWQTVQNDPIDFCTEGFTTRKAVWTADDVVHMLETKVRLQGLLPHIRLGHKLAGYAWSDKEQQWVCQVSRLTDGANLEIRARRILLGTGKHARPIIPPIPNDNSVAIMHSSQMTDFAAAASGKRVAVVGAGASGLDLCLNSLEAGAAGPVEWILREPKFFSGCEVRTMWPMVMLQLMLGAFALHLLNLAVNLAVFLHHSLAGTRSWVPRAWFDMRRTQYVPGRSLLLRRRKDLSRHAGAEVSKVEGGAVHLSTGEVLHGIDTLLLGTGYAPPERPDGFEKPTNFAAFLATGPKAAGKLLLVGEDLLDATGASPFGACTLFTSWTASAGPPPHPALLDPATPEAGPRRLLNGVEPLLAAAPLSRARFPFAVWRLRVGLIYMYYRLVHRTTVFFPERIIKLGLVLDDLPRAPPSGVDGAPASAGVEGLGVADDSALTVVIGG